MIILASFKQCLCNFSFCLLSHCVRIRVVVISAASSYFQALQ